MNDWQKIPYHSMKEAQQAVRYLRSSTPDTGFHGGHNRLNAYYSDKTDQWHIGHLPKKGRYRLNHHRR
jgi:hypothetical protein